MKAGTLLLWVEWISPACVILSLLLPFAPPRIRLRWSGLCSVLLVLQALLVLRGWGALAYGTALGICLLALGYSVHSILRSRRIKRAWLARYRAAPPLVLALPFEGRWKALGCGPNVARNHHLKARDQWFAVDWVRFGEPSFGSRILSPVAGVVAHVEDGHPDKPARRRVQPEPSKPAGNYVAIETRYEDRSAWVILAHLERGSIAVRLGDRVFPGDPIARCGNSGRTSQPHLHVHGQWQAEVQPGHGWGCPLVFTGPEGRNWMPRPGQLIIGLEARRSAV